MKEQLHTIPIVDALREAGECPFCFIEKRSEERMMDFVLGPSSSYMEADIREQTDKAGFCRAHFKKMFDYGNALGNAWILKTHVKKTVEELEAAAKGYQPGKKPLFGKPKTVSPVVEWGRRRETSCYICDTLESTFRNYVDTFLTMYRKDPAVKEAVFAGQGFCVTHFTELLDAAEKKLPSGEFLEFYQEILPFEKQQLERIFEDVAWFVEKYDYKNRDADWKNSKDALQRAMQKMKGRDPSDPPYEMKK